MTEKQVSPLDPHKDELIEMALQGLSNTAMAAAFTARGVSTTKDSIRRAFKRWNFSRPNANLGEPTVSLTGDTATIQGGDPSGTEITPDQLMRLHGLDPDDWEIKNLIVNKWDAMVGEKLGNAKRPMYQLKLHLVRKRPIEFVFPGRVPSEYTAPVIRRKVGSMPLVAPYLKVIVGDNQVPHHDRGMEDCLLQFLAEIKPDELIDIGDQGDNPSVSTHAKNEQWHVPINECIQGTVELNYYRRRAYEQMKMTILLGNHDERVKRYTQARAEALYGIKQGDIPNDPVTGANVLEWAYLTRADDLNITVIANEDDNYFQQSFTIVEGEHGAIAEHGSNSGKNVAQKVSERRHYSIFYGHTHDQSIETKTVWDIHGNHRTYYLVNIGSGTKIKGGLGYAKLPDWVNGFATLSDWGDGRFHVDLAKYEDGVLYWRDKRWFASPESLAA